MMLLDGKGQRWQSPDKYSSSRTRIFESVVSRYHAKMVSAGRWKNLVVRCTIAGRQPIQLHEVHTMHPLRISSTLSIGIELAFARSIRLMTSHRLGASSSNFPKIQKFPQLSSFKCRFLAAFIVIQLFDHEDFGSLSFSTLCWAWRPCLLLKHRLGLSCSLHFPFFCLTVLCQMIS